MADRRGRGSGAAVAIEGERERERVRRLAGVHPFRKNAMVEAIDLMTR
jgi:hypothetical protein